MPFVVEDGTGKADANSVVSFDDWTAYFEFHPYGTACKALTEAQAQPYMVTATREVLSSFTFKGDQLSTAQALKFPREGIVLPSNSASVEVYKLGNENISNSAYLELPASPLPQSLKNAVLEYCRFLKTKDRSSELDELGNIKREKVGPLETEYFDTTKTDVMPEIVQRCLSELTVSDPDTNVGRGSYIITSRA